MPAPAPVRTMPAALQSALAAPVVLPALLVYGDFPAGPVRAWTGYSNLIALGETWLPLGDLLAVEPILETVDSAQRGMGLTLSGIPSSIFDPVEMGTYHGRRADLYLGAFTESGTLVSEPLLLFSGQMDSDEVTDDGQTVTIRIDVLPELHDHLMPRAFRYTHNDQAALYPTAQDRGFEYMSGLQNALLRWGPDS